MGAGGIIVPPATYFEKIQAVLKKHDVLLVADEVICGFGRTGDLWGSQSFDLRPDILTCAKALSSGYIPISAIMVNERVFRPIAEQSAGIGVLGHGFTYSGHPVAAAVAIETLKIYDEIDLLGMVRAAAPTLQDGIRQFAAHELVGETTGIGMLAVAELVAHKATKQPSIQPAKSVLICWNARWTTGWLSARWVIASDFHRRWSCSRIKLPRCMPASPKPWMTRGNGSGNRTKSEYRAKSHQNPGAYHH